MRLLMALLIVGFVLMNGAFAGVLPGGFTGVLEVTYEDDRLDSDMSLGKSKITFKRPMQVGEVSVTPYVYMEDESNDGIWSSNCKETESAIGVDFVALKNDSVKMTLSTIYEYEYNAGTDDDALAIIKLKTEF